MDADPPGERGRQHGLGKQPTNAPGLVHRGKGHSTSRQVTRRRWDNRGFRRRERRQRRGLRNQIKRLSCIEWVEFYLVIEGQHILSQIRIRPLI